MDSLIGILGKEVSCEELSRQLYFFAEAHHAPVVGAMQVTCEDPRFFDLCFAKLDLPPGTLWTPPLHPSPLYEAVFEGFVLFALVWIFSMRPRPTGSVTAMFLLGYGLARFSVEFIRMPDSNLDYLAFGWLTMGHVLTLPMIVGGILLFWLSYRRWPDSRTVQHG